MQCVVAMRQYDDEDFKQPRPLQHGRKGPNAWESEEAGDLREVCPIRKDNERDHHRHVRL